MPFDVGSIQAHLTLDRTEFSTELELAEKQAQEFAREYEATLGLNITEFETKMSEAERRLRDWAASGAEAKLLLDISDVLSDSAAANGILADFSGSEATATFNGNTAPFMNDAAQVTTVQQLIDGTEATVDFNGDTSDLRAAGVEANMITDSVSRMAADVRIDGDTSGLRRGATEATGIVAFLKALKAEVFIGADNSDLRRKDQDSRSRLLNLTWRPWQAIMTASNDPLRVIWGQSMDLLRRFQNTRAGAFLDANNISFLAKMRDAFNRLFTFNNTRVRARLEADDSRFTPAIRRAHSLLVGLGNTAAVLRNILGRDGTLARRVGNTLADSFAAIAFLAVDAAQGLIKFFQPAVDAGIAAGGAAVKAGSAAGSFGRLLGPVGALVGPLLAIGGLLGVVAGGLGGLIGLAAAGIGIFGATALAIGLLALPLLGLKTDSADAKREYAQLMDELEYNFFPAFNAAMGPAITKMGDFAQKIVNLSTTTLPLLGSAAYTATQNAIIGFENAAYYIGEHGGENTFYNVLDSISRLLDDITYALTVWGWDFLMFMEIIAPYAERFWIAVGGAGEDLMTWMQSEEGREKLEDFFDAVEELAPAVGYLFWTVGEALVWAFVTNGPTIVWILRTIADILYWIITVSAYILWFLAQVVYYANLIVTTLNALSPKSMAEWATGGPPDGGDSGGIWGHHQSPESSAHPDNVFDENGQFVNFAMGGDMQLFARGGDSKKKRRGTNPDGASYAADGLAHFVENTTVMNMGTNTAVYGEALSPGEREYAFPMDGGWRFITTDPAHDGQSYSLWRDLGQRMGYIADSTREMFGGQGGRRGVPSPVTHTTAGQAQMPNATAATASHSVARRLNRRRKSKEVAVINVIVKDKILQQEVTEITWENMDDSLRNGMFAVGGLS